MSVLRAHVAEHVRSWLYDVVVMVRDSTDDILQWSTARNVVAFDVVLHDRACDDARAGSRRNRTERSRRGAY